MAYPGGAPVTIVGGQAGNASGGAAGTSANPLLTRDANPSGVDAGQAKVATGGTAVQLPSRTYANGVIVKADVDNPGKMTIGGAGVTATTDGTGNGYILSPGEPTSLGVTNLNTLYINGPAGSIVSWFAN